MGGEQIAVSVHTLSMWLSIRNHGRDGGGTTSGRRDLESILVFSVPCLGVCPSFILEAVRDKRSEIGIHSFSVNFLKRIK